MLAATDEELVKTYFAQLLLKDYGGGGLQGGTRGQRESTLARGRDLTRDDERVLYSKYLFSLAYLLYYLILLAPTLAIDIDFYP